LITLLNNESDRLKTYHQWQTSRINTSLSDRLEIATTRILYLAIEKSTEAQFDILKMWESCLNLTRVKEQFNELDLYSI
jgi:ABC-type multidrug transport system fused ATPase/permease subunit